MSSPKAAFTICSNNYLGQALALKQSFLNHNKDFQFYIFLVDEYSDQIDYSVFEPATIILAKDIKGLDFNTLLEKYYIIELNTSIKASAFKHLKAINNQLKLVYYLDPDLYFYNSLAELDAILETKSMVLTPHIVSPIDRDGHMPDENIFLRFGIYNLGFLGVNVQHSSTQKMLDWWEHRTLNYGYDRPHKGYFVDQLWMNFTHLFFDDVHIVSHKGYNMAPWNLHEREVKEINNDGRVILDNGEQLVFYHFSKITMNFEAISREYDRYNFGDFEKLKEFYQAYNEVLKSVNYSAYKEISIAYPVKLNLKPVPEKPSFFTKVFRKMGAMFYTFSEKF